MPRFNMTKALVLWNCPSNYGPLFLGYPFWLLLGLSITSLFSGLYTL